MSIFIARQLSQSCSFPPPSDCGGHGTLQGCTCTCSAGYATDYTDLQTIQWCALIVNGSRNTTTGGRDNDLPGGVVYNSTTPMPATQRSAVGSFFGSPVGIVVLLVLAGLCIGGVAWCCNRHQQGGKNKGSGQKQGCCCQCLACSCSALCWSTKACSSLCCKMCSNPEPQEQRSRSRSRLDSEAYIKAAYRQRAGGIHSQQMAAYHVPGSDHAAALLSQQMAALTAVAMQQSQLLSMQQQHASMRPSSPQHDFDSIPVGDPRHDFVHSHARAAPPPVAYIHNHRLAESIMDHPKIPQKFMRVHSNPGYDP